MADQFPPSAFQDTDVKGGIGTKRPSPTANRAAASNAAPNLADYNLAAQIAAAQSMYPTPLQIPTNPQFNASGNSPSAPSPVSGLPNSPYNYSPFAAMNMMGMMNLANYGFNNALGRVAGQPTVPSLNIPAAQAYSPIASLASAGAGNGRTVYIGNLPPDALIDELLSLVKFGPIESVRILGEKSCAFISFLDGATAAAFHADATLKKLSLHGVELKVGWGKHSPVPAPVLLAIQQSNATRNVYLGGLDENVTEAQLRDDLSRFGLIDQIKIVRDKGIGFVHFLSIATATKVVNTLPTEPAWAGKRVNYGKDRCAFVPKTTPAAQAAVQVAANTLSQASPGLFNPFSPYDSPNTPASAMAFMAAAAGGISPGAGGLNRTVYLGNIHPETTTEDLCNAIRGGVLQSIRYMQDKHIAFITFIDPAAAFTFYQVASYQGLTLNNRRLKVGWGKNSGPLSPALALAVHSGATRNVYIGGIEDFELFNEERLKRDFGEYGDIELVNYLKEKNCAFVNFTNISNAIKAIDGIKNKPEYANLRIAHGKDRCANPPRSSNGSAGGPRKGTGPTVSVTSPTADGDEDEDDKEVAALAAQAEEELLKEEESLRA